MRTARRRGDHLAAYVGPWLGLEAGVGVCFVAVRGAYILIGVGSRVRLQSVDVVQARFRSVVIVVGMLVCGSNAAALNDCAVHHKAARQGKPASRDDPPDLKLGVVTQRSLLQLHVRRCRPQPRRYVALHSFSPGSLIVVG